MATATALPTAVIIDRKGIIRYVETGSGVLASAVGPGARAEKQKEREEEQQEEESKPR